MTCAVALLVIPIGCASPFDVDRAPLNEWTGPSEVSALPTSVHRSANNGHAAATRSNETEVGGAAAADDLAAADVDGFVRLALERSHAVEAAHQRWRVAAERVPQVVALPDPEVGLRYSAMDKEAFVGVMQSFPWPGTLSGRGDAASSAAMAEWRIFEATRLSVAERVVEALYELAYLDAATRIAEENLEIVGSFEAAVRARYRVGVGSHPDLLRTQVAIGVLEDRIRQLRDLRPALVAELNATMSRPTNAVVPPVPALPSRRAVGDSTELVDAARRHNPALLALEERTRERRHLTDVARREGLPSFTVGFEWMFEDRDVVSRSNPGDPVMVSLGVRVPLWRERYDAGIREGVAARLAVSHERLAEADRLAAAIHRAHYEHHDADRRVMLYRQTLIPKAEESLAAALGAYRTGETAFLDLLDAERMLLEFAVAAERARADRGQALARLNALVGTPIDTEEAAP